MVKTVRKKAKISSNLGRHETVPHPSDRVINSYQIVNHKKGEANEYTLKVNPTQMQSSTQLNKSVAIPKDLIRTNGFDYGHYSKAMNESTFGKLEVEKSGVESEVLDNGEKQKVKIYSL